LFSTWLSGESKEANKVKKDTPVMVIMGNPPYSGESVNKGGWIMGLMEDYKKEPGGTEKLKERNPKWINDDYVKFLRYGQHFIEKTGSGILAFVNPHGYLDNPTFRGMRWHLLNTYDDIYIIDLHGNAKKKETCPDGSKDENVFDIMQGVSINLLIKTGKKKKGTLAQIHHFDLYGRRKFKYDFLEHTAFEDVPYQPLPNVEPMYFMTPKDFKAQAEYDKGFSVKDMFGIKNVGIVTSRDGLVIDFDKTTLVKRIKSFFELPAEQVKTKLGVRENKSWNIENIQNNNYFDDSFIHEVGYRPFDIRKIYFDSGFIERSRLDVMSHFFRGENIGLSLCKQFKSGDKYVHSFISNQAIESSYVSNKTSEITSIFPLYLYPNDKTKRNPNLNHTEIKVFEKNLSLPFVAEKQEGNSSFAPIDVLDYIYAVLHSPNYRDKFKEFLKIDFPRMPYPNSDTFWQLVEIDSQIRQLHLIESPLLNELEVTYPQAGDNIITRKLTKTNIGYEPTSNEQGKVWINDEQYFDNVPLIAWKFYIGGYQPAQKWLKDRKGRELSFDDIVHYQKIIKALIETNRLMQEVDNILVV
jgi:predicted helicase